MGLYRAVASEYILCPHDRKKIQEKRQTEKIHWEQKWFTALSIKKCGKKSALLKISVPCKIDMPATYVMPLCVDFVFLMLKSIIIAD